jgi:hypothetical protein
MAPDLTYAQLTMGRFDDGQSLARSYDGVGGQSRGAAHFREDFEGASVR